MASIKSEDLLAAIRALAVGFLEGEGAGRKASHSAFGRGVVRVQLAEAWHEKLKLVSGLGDKLELGG